MAALVQSILMTLYIALVLYAAWKDAHALRIPNAISLALLAIFFPQALLSGIGLDTVAWHLLAGLLLLIIGFTLFAFKLFGGGDAKLLAACALWVGWDALLGLIVSVVLAGGVLSIAVILLRKGVGLWPDWLVQKAGGLFASDKAIPYGIAIAVGAMLTVPKMDTLPPAWRTMAAFIAG